MYKLLCSRLGKLRPLIKESSIAWTILVLNYRQIFGGYIQLRLQFGFKKLKWNSGFLNRCEKVTICRKFEELEQNLFSSFTKSYT